MNKTDKFLFKEITFRTHLESFNIITIISLFNIVHVQDLIN